MGQQRGWDAKQVKEKGQKVETPSQTTARAARRGLRTQSEHDNVTLVAVVTKCHELSHLRSAAFLNFELIVFELKFELKNHPISPTAVASLIPKPSTRGRSCRKVGILGGAGVLIQKSIDQFVICLQSVTYHTPTDHGGL